MNMLRRFMTAASYRSYQCWAFSTSAKIPTKGREEPDDEKLILPSLRKFVNRPTVAMQMPDMTRRYAVSDAPLIPSYFLGKLQLVWFYDVSNII